MTSVTTWHYKLIIFRNKEIGSHHSVSEYHWITPRSGIYYTCRPTPAEFNFKNLKLNSNICR